MSGDITVLLRRVSAGDSSAEAELMNEVYGELKRLATKFLRRERKGHTLQATALVHEAFIKLAGNNKLEFTDRAHFFAIASRVMRRVLIEHARARATGKRGGGRTKIELREDAALEQAPSIDILILDHVLKRLAKLDRRKSRIVELRFFAGLTIEETAEVLGVGIATTKEHWALAKAWLKRELKTS